jgi:Carboxypeptidase regulatory-like domain
MNSRTCFSKAIELPLLAAFVLMAASAQAQVTSVTGKVTDSGGAVVPGATVTITGSTGAIRTDITNEVGVYRFLQLAPGVYQIKAELQGFKTAVRERVELLVDTPTTADLQLDVGQIAQTVVVEEGTSKLNTVDGTLGNAINGLQIRQLPLESRNVATLLSVQPGVTSTGYVTGARSDQSNLTLDGIDVNEQQTGEAFQTVLRITPDSVQEFRVTTATPTATQGRSSGGQVSLITRTGNNQWHGSLYHFHRNTVTTANDFFNNRSGVERPKLLRNLFGGSVGGPIAEDRAFFFYNYEGQPGRSAVEDGLVYRREPAV